MQLISTLRTDMAHVIQMPPCESKWYVLYCQKHCLPKDDLTTCEAWSSEATVLTLYSDNIPVLARQGLI